LGVVFLENGGEKDFSENFRRTHPKRKKLRTENVALYRFDVLSFRDNWASSI